MKSSFLRTTVVALTMCFGLSAGSANAAIYMTGWEGTYLTGYQQTFGNPLVSSSFDDYFSFSIPTDTLGNGGSNVISLGSTNALFTSFDLYESSNLIATGIIDNLASSGPSASLTFSNGAVPGAYSLNVVGYKVNPGVSASYVGNINVSAVPEPETYAMLLAGLGLIGFTARRRKNNA